MLKSKWFLCLLILLTLTMVACQPKETIIVVTATPAPTELPTATSIPTVIPTATIEPTPTPEGQIFYDGFEKELQPGWDVENEDTLKWAFTNDGWLKIVAGDDCLLSSTFQKNLFLQYAPEGNFVIETRMKADADTNFQQASIYLIEDTDNYFTINRGYCLPCKPGGPGIYSDYAFKGEWGSFSGRAYSDEQVYLRISVNRERKEIIAYYSADGEKWTQLRKIPMSINVNQIGLGTSNCDGENIDDNLVAEFDYFKVSVLE